MPAGRGGKDAVTLLDSSNTHTKIIDASTAHRTEPGWAYGFPELSPQFRKNIETNRFIANPGCYASGFIAIVYPLIKHGVIERDYPSPALRSPATAAAAKARSSSMRTPSGIRSLIRRGSTD